MSGDTYVPATPAAIAQAVQADLDRILGNTRPTVDRVQADVDRDLADPDLTSLARSIHAHPATQTPERRAELAERILIDALQTDRADRQQAADDLRILAADHNCTPGIASELRCIADRLLFGGAR
jgi:hypothetical protein